jgi:hypothetical protein
LAFLRAIIILREWSSGQSKFEFCSPKLRVLIREAEEIIEPGPSVSAAPGREERGLSAEGPLESLAEKINNLCRAFGARICS